MSSPQEVEPGVCSGGRRSGLFQLPGGPTVPAPPHAACPQQGKCTRVLPSSETSVCTTRANTCEQMCAERGGQED